MYVCIYIYLLRLYLLAEGGHVAVVDKVNEGVAHVALVLEVDGEVDQVELALHKKKTTILRAATTTSTIKCRCAVARSVFV